MRLSIALCTYNGARFLSEQLQSLLEQRRLPDQIVVCDDGSSDGTSAMLEEFASMARLVGVQVEIYFNEVNLGYIRNFEKAISLCDGDVVFLCDQDDIWHADKLARYESLFGEDPSIIVIHGDADLIDANAQLLGHGLFDAMEVTEGERSTVNAGFPLGVLLRRNIVTGATMAFRRCLAELALPVADGWSHDEWLAMVAAINDWRIVCLDWASIGYRQHGNNQIGARRLSALQKLQGAGIDRRSYFGNRAQCMNLLLDRAGGERWLAPAQRAALEQCAMHCRARASISSGALRRLVTVGNEVRNRNYWIYSHGWRSAVADLMGRR